MLELDTPIQSFQNVLTDLGWINNERVLKISSPGAGNMNVVLRVTTDKRTFILKQSRPFVQKYQDIPAPIERISTEFKFYDAIKGSLLDNHVPKIINYSEKHHLVMMQDLGDCDDMSFIYQQPKINSNHLDQLVNIVRQTHQTKAPSDFPINMALRQLNHQHIFVLPFLEDNGFQLDDVHDGLQALSLPYKKDEDLKSIVNHLGQLYLAEGDTLLHGDYYPGSWMVQNDRIYMIDPEFCFVGFKEFDLGIMMGHLILSTSDKRYVDKVIELYGGSVDRDLSKQIAGVEIMRRLIGLAQLPLKRSLNEKNNLLQIAYQLIIES